MVREDGEETDRRGVLNGFGVGIGFAVFWFVIRSML